MRQQIRRSMRVTGLERRHFTFVFEFLKKNRRHIGALVSLLLLQAILEISALMFVNSSIRDRAYTAFHQGYLTILLGGILVSIAIYLTVSFFALKIERGMVLGFINTLRRNWFKLILSRTELSMTHDRGADFIAKASYHFPLVSLGIDHSALGTLRWALCACILLVVGSIGGGSLLVGACAIIVLSGVVGFGAYMVANHYISQEVASYSQVIRYIDSSLSEFAAIKTFHQENGALKDLDARVNNDTYFRIRRDIWLRYFSKVVYTVLFLGTLAVLIFGFYHPAFFLGIYASDDVFLAGIISLYSIRIFYEAGRTGLYVPPLRLGLILSIPEKMVADFKIKKENPWSTLEFKSNKVKLHLEANYFKNVSIHLQKGKSYLFSGAPYSGKTSIAELFSGKARFNKDAWLVKLDTARLDYRQWAGEFHQSFFISPYFYSEKTIGEIIFGKEKQNITAEDLFTVYAIAEKHPLLSILVSKKRFVGESLKVFQANGTLLFAAYILHCLVRQPSLIIVDNQWLDLSYPEINDLVMLVRRELPGSTIAVFARTNNDILPYDEKYEIQTNEIKRI